MPRRRPPMPADQHVTFTPKPQPAPESWWISLTREQFTERARREAERMQRTSQTPTGRSS